MMFSRKIAAVLAFLPTLVIGTCDNDKNYSITYGGKYLTCSKLRMPANSNARQALCATNPATLAACPHSCGTCCEDASASAYKFLQKNGAKSQPCSWILKGDESKDAKRREGYCKKGYWSNGSAVRAKCQVSCDFCFDPVTSAPATPAPFPTMTVAPTASPTLNPTSSPTSTISEVDILRLFYESTDGDNWRNKDGWVGYGADSIAEHCDWYGVTCANGVVTKLVLSYDNGLKGSIPSELAQLSSLKVLYLVGSPQLAGAIPSELGKLSSLENLSLGGNRLTGTIPSDLGNLSSLERLDLSGENQLTGTIPSELGKLSSLENFRLDGNRLTGTIPSDLGNLSSLKVLRLGGNLLAGAIPSDLGKLSSLAEMELGTNQLIGAIPSHLGNLSSLESLTLFGNMLTGTIPSQLENMASLLTLKFSGNGLTGTIPSELGNLSSLKWSLNLNSNQLTGVIPSELGKLSSLRELYLYSNQLTSPVTIPDEVCSIPSLISLITDSCGSYLQCCP